MSDGGSLRHAVVVYGSDEELRHRVAPFLQEGLAAGETVVVVVAPRTAALLQGALAGTSGDIRWGVPGVDYSNLGPMVDGLRRYLAAEHEAGHRLRLLAENDTAGDASRTAAYLRFEAAANDVLGTYDFSWVCLYDGRRYPAETLAQAVQVYPRMVDGEGREIDSSEFVPPDAYLGANPGPVSPVPATVSYDAVFERTGQLSTVRRGATGAARELGLSEAAAEDFQLAAGEALSNAVRHGDRPCRARLWATDGHVVLRVEDQGPGDNIAVKGFRPPDPRLGHLGGMGMWMIRHLADAVHVMTGAAGTAVELQFLRVHGHEDVKALPSDA